MLGNDDLDFYDEPGGAGSGGAPAIIEVIVPAESDRQRVDVFLATGMEPGLSRSQVQRLIKKGLVTVGGEIVKQNRLLGPDERVVVTVPPPERLDLEAENIPLDIVYQDSDLAVINKQPGLVVHPGPGNYRHTLVNALLFHLKDLSAIGGVERPGIVHRLDRDTSGLLVVAKNDASHAFLTGEFAGRKVNKLYRALVAGRPRSGHAVLDGPIGRHRVYRHKMTVDPAGRPAVTEYTVNRVWNTRKGIYTLLDVAIHTGRTHQIRVHLAHEGIPVVGDPVYSKKWEKHGVPYLLLASTVLEFEHPGGGGRMRFEAPMPAHMTEFIARLDRMGARP